MIVTILNRNKWCYLLLIGIKQTAKETKGFTY